MIRFLKKLRGNNMMGLAGKLMGGGSKISFVSVAAAAGANTVALPTHAAGDLIIVHCYNDNNTSFPTTPSGGYTSLIFNSAGTIADRVFYKIATSGSETLGTSTNATDVSATVYRGVNASNPFGNKNLLVNGDVTSTSIRYPQISTGVTPKSWVVLLAGCSASTGATFATPTATVNRVTSIGAADSIIVNDTGSAVGSTTWADRLSAVNQTVKYMARSIEIFSA
jgi:hypothetical protein